MGYEPAALASPRRLLKWGHQTRLQTYWFRICIWARTPIWCLRNKALETDVERASELSRWRAGSLGVYVPQLLDCQWSSHCHSFPDCLMYWWSMLQRLCASRLVAWKALSSGIHVANPSTSSKSLLKAYSSMRVSSINFVTCRQQPGILILPLFSSSL